MLQKPGRAPAVHVNLLGLCATLPLPNLPCALFCFPVDKRMAARTCVPVLFLMVACVFFAIIQGK